MKSVAKENSRIGLRPRRCLIALFMAGASASGAAIFEVNTSTDPAAPITVGCDATECTLREAITAANALAGADEVHFEIAGSGERLVALTSPLPNITQTLKIDGYTQSGTAENTAATTSDAILLVRIDGSGAGPSATGLRICAPNSVVQGLAMTGFAVAAIGAGGGGCSASSGSVIRGNFFGLTTDGSTAAANTGDALSLQSSVYTVGGPNPGDRNVIARSNNGVFLQNSTTIGSLVLNNLVGTDRSGLLNRGNSFTGILLGSAANNIVVGSAAAPNLVAFNQRGLVTISGSGNQLHHNRVHSNIQLGIDLGNNGVTANDLNDVDTGTNALQNFPVITGATVGVGTIDVTGTLDVGHVGDINYTLGLYVSDRCDTSGHGEGERIIGMGSANLSTSVEAFALNFSTTEPFVGRVFLTMTATHPVDGTSEFSQCFNVNPDVPLIVNSADDVSDGACDTTHCSLRDAITDANAVPGHDRIHFNIPGAGPHRINLGVHLPAFTSAITIDGYSEPGANANTHPSASNAALTIIVDAGAYATASGAVFNLGSTNAAGSLIRGLSIVDIRGGAPAILVNVDADIEGNWFGIEPDGVTTGGSLAGAAVRFSGVGLTIGGPLPAQRNVFAGSNAALNGFAASSNVLIENNLVGLRPDGVTGQTNLNGLLWSSGAQSDVVVRNNTISCNSGSLFGFGTLVEGNRFGTNSDGSAVPASCTPNGRAVPANGSRWVGNLFAFHTARAVEVGVGNAASFSRNRFFGNVTYDLDLNSDGHSANDTLDVDGGGNGTQNFPLLTTARRLSDTQLEISGTLNSLASTTFTIEFFGNSATTRTALGGTVLLADARWVGSESINVTTDAAGVASFGPTTVNFPTAVKVNVVSATATRLDGASNPLETSEVGPAISSFAAGGADLVVTNTLASGEGSFFAAVNEANARPDTGVQRDRITFNIPGPGPHLITPTLTSLNLIDRIEIDGYSQPGTAMNSLAVGSNAVIAIELRNIALDFSGASDVLIRGISIDGTPPSPLPYLRLNGNSVLEGSFVGVASNGTTLLSNLANGTPAIACSSSGCGRIGGVAVSARNLLGVLASANNATVLTSATGPSLVRNNLVGMRRDGTTRLITNATTSIGIHSQSTTGPAAGDTIQDNVIGGLGIGLRIGGNGAIVTGNVIGIGGDGITAAANNAQGILVAAGSAHTISSNTVPNNGGDGIELASTASAVALIDNRIFANNGLGIDLNGDGVTANDAGDGDVGANARQNFPVLTSALHDIDGVVLSGTLNATPETDFRVRFCLVQGNTDSHGECTAPAVATFVDVHTDGSGNASFASPPIPFVVNMTHASATAARLVAGGEETSEFAQTIAIRRAANIAIQSIASASVRFGEQFTTSVLVSTPIAGSAPTGSVAITTTPDVGSCTIASLTAGTGACAITALGSGDVVVNAIYAGDAITVPATTSSPLSILKAPTITTILTDAADPSTPGAELTLTFSVTSSNGTPTGQVVVTATGGGTCNGVLAAGNGNCLLTPAGSGPITLTASYGGDTNFETSSDDEAHVIGAAGSSLLISTTTPNPSVFGQAVQVSATLSSSFGTPSGPILISDSAGATCQITGNSGSCALVPTNVGNNLTLRADFAGDAAHTSSTASVDHSVIKANVTLTPGLPFLSDVATDIPVQFLAMRVPVDITASAPGAGTPTGTIIVNAVLPDTELCVITLPATFCDLVPLTSGIRAFTASYNGDANFNGNSAGLDTPVLDFELFTDGFECRGLECL